MLNSLVGDDFVRTGFQAERAATLKDFEYTDQYLTREEIAERVARAGLSPAKPPPSSPTTSATTMTSGTNSATASGTNSGKRASASSPDRR
jgi:hypothetical protein